MFLPGYSLLGLIVMTVSEAAMLLRIEPFWSWHTPIAWTGYILFIDGIVRRRRGGSWLTSAPAEFVFLAVVSLPLWLVFEFYNLYIRNWHYVNLPEHAWARNLGYAWSFATIWPAIFETADLVASFRSPSGPAQHQQGALARGGLPSRLAGAAMVGGAAMLVWPIVWPSPYLAAPVWLGFILLLDPINHRLGGASLFDEAAAGRWDRAVNLAIAGLGCGFLWEFWNFWARTKWIYTVPIVPNAKIFEMPIAGYLGFPAFALECLAMYETVRTGLWRGPKRAIGL